ncbi:MAG: hypothetical protein LQ351_004058 [Letrouitia transgressa]|nr:MAG: hypothetical protein LQ351_004058 [Letrouitia transgressa]
MSHNYNLLNNHNPKDFYYIYYDHNLDHFFHAQPNESTGLQTHNNGQSTYAGTGSAGGNTYAYLSVDNGSPGGPGRPYFKQTIPGLCGNTYTLNYTSSLFIRDGQPYHFCRAFIDLDDQQLVFIGGPNGDIPPWQTETRSYTFTYTGGTAPPNTLTVSFDCATASYGSYTIDDISLVGAGEGN